jgi:hypothetical protein
LTVTGPDAFKQRAVAAAVEFELNVKFSDPAMETQRLQMTEARRQAEREAQRLAQEAAKEAQAQADRAAALKIDQQREAAQQAAAEVKVAQEAAAAALALDKQREAAEVKEQAAIKAAQQAEVVQVVSIPEHDRDDGPSHGGGWER